MFGYMGDESDKTVARKIAYAAGAQRRWPLLTRCDLTTLHNELQLASIVKDRSEPSKRDGDAAVHVWMEEKDF